MCKTVKEDIIQNLEDAGCEKELVSEIIELYDKSKKEKIQEKLQVHRKKILDKEHKAQKQIDCLDFFLYQMKKEEKKIE